MRQRASSIKNKIQGKRNTLGTVRSGRAGEVKGTVFARTMKVEKALYKKAENAKL